MRINWRLAALAWLLLAATTLCDTDDGGVEIGPHVFGAIRARDIGPATMGGRIAAVAVLTSDPRTIYLGAASGGVWRSVNGGVTFEPVFDKYTQSIGALAIDQERPDTIWVGTGEPWVRNSVSVGTGVYKTTDGAKTWSLMGLEDSERIGEIIIDPRDPNAVYAAVLGHLWNASEQRGLYKTTDGGRNWERILYVGDGVGCSDIALDPENPDVVYATMWEFRRTPYSFNSGGPGSGIYKSTDAGVTWRELRDGLPEGDLGRVAIAVAPSDADRVYAVVESEETALYRSDDKGEHWQRKGTAGDVKSRPFYFSLLLVDPQDADRIYKPATFMAISKDGGETFSGSATSASAHPDFHALWINPDDPNHLLLGTDGGLYLSHDRGYNWLFLNSLPLSQFYHVSCDSAKPYNVYGGLQDNGSWRGPSRSPGGVENKDWDNIGHGDGFYVLVDPADANILYYEYQGGNIYRRDNTTGESKDVKPYPDQGEPKYRFNWNTPIALSPSDPDRLYIGAQFLLRSTDKGESWQRLSDDLTTNDPEKQRQNESGGLTIDNTTAENHCTIYTISESPLDAKLIWAGTDDGNVQVTENDGRSWQNVAGAITGLPDNTWCSGIEASRHDRQTAYAVFDGHRSGDMATYVYKTTDLGKTWTSLVTDSLRGYAHVIREDLVRPDILFLGTEFGLFVSIDGGGHWAQFREGLPNVAVRDMVIHPGESDLILATHGRGIYVVDDITPLRQLTPEVLASEVSIFTTEPAIITTPKYLQEFSGDARYVGSNPAELATIAYYLKKRHIFGDCKVEIYDGQGSLIKTLPGGKRKGVNLVNWYMRMKPPKVAPAQTLASAALFGPAVPEGTYAYKLIKGKETYGGEIVVAADPASPHTASDRALQQKTTMTLYRMQEDLAYVAAAADDAREQAEQRADELGENDDLQERLLQFVASLKELRDTLVVDDERQGITMAEKLRERAIDLYGSVSFYGGRPSDTQLMRMSKIEDEIAAAESQFNYLIEDNLEDINSRLTEREVEPIKLLTREEFDKKQ